VTGAAPTQTQIDAAAALARDHDLTVVSTNEHRATRQRQPTTARLGAPRHRQAGGGREYRVADGEFDLITVPSGSGMRLRSVVPNTFGYLWAARCGSRTTIWAVMVCGMVPPWC
jgi:hypothetical protein